jgi:hypothetical protein
LWLGCGVWRGVRDGDREQGDGVSRGVGCGVAGVGVGVGDTGVGVGSATAATGSGGLSSGTVVLSKQHLRQLASC